MTKYIGSRKVLNLLEEVISNRLFTVGSLPRGNDNKGTDHFLGRVNGHPLKRTKKSSARCNVIMSGSC